jgi:hypothetical protein
MSPATKERERVGEKDEPDMPVHRSSSPVVAAAALRCWVLLFEPEKAAVSRGIAGNSEPVACQHGRAGHGRLVGGLRQSGRGFNDGIDAPSWPAHHGALGGFCQSLRRWKQHAQNPRALALVIRIVRIVIGFLQRWQRGARRWLSLRSHNRPASGRSRRYRRRWVRCPFCEDVQRRLRAGLVPRS